MTVQTLKRIQRATRLDVKKLKTEELYYIGKARTIRDRICLLEHDANELGNAIDILEEQETADA